MRTSAQNVRGGLSFTEWGLIFFSFLVALPFSGCRKDHRQLRQVTLTCQPVIAGDLDIFVAGTFNDWNASVNRMTDTDQDGVYEAELLLAPGRYEYKFVINGDWKTDFNAEELMGAGREGDNSVLYVDDRYEKVVFEPGDGRIHDSNLNLEVGYRMLDPYADGSVRITVPALKNDVEQVSVIYSGPGGSLSAAMMERKARGRIHDYFQTVIAFDELRAFNFYFSYTDGALTKYAGSKGFFEEVPGPAAMFRYDPQELPVFKTPDWAKEGVFYQIFPDRFRNGDPGNDPDFSERYYEGKNRLPEGGKTNEEYFHLEDWDRIEGLTESPYRTDGKPDYFSFYGGDIAGVMEKLDYLQQLGITIIYFNPLNEGKSNHKYDPVDYLKIDPHFADEALFKRFTAAAAEKGIRIIVDKAFNHTGDEHFAFVDTREKGDASPYWLWYEWRTWPLPPEGAPTPNDYYDCWWGFPLHPNLNFDLSRENKDENMIRDITQAEPNREVVDYLLETAQYWIGELGIAGFRLDVPNEVPFWFWKLFREKVLSLDKDAYLIGEIWGNALPWLGEDGFHSTMNYKYFRDPVLDFFASRSINAAEFDEALAPGRLVYPREAVLAMMNLIDSHDTVRFLTLAGGDVRRLKLAALFQMTYPGIPQVYYGDEVALQGGKDPDNRRPFPWDWQEDPERRQVHEFYSRLIRIRREHPCLVFGGFETLYAKGHQFIYTRSLNGRTILVCLNNSGSDAEILLPENIRNTPEDGNWKCLLDNRIVNFGDNARIDLDAYEGVILIN